jgi:UDP-2,3-diacylglucosamine hydrolase
MDGKLNTHKILLPSDKKVYFASDQHFGAPDHQSSKIREQLFLNWLDSIKPTAAVLFLLGDLFDFWFEYKYVVPKGFVRILGKLAEFQDAGIAIIFFTGNHDLWMEDYLQKEIGITLFRESQSFQINQKLFFIGHGDGLGPGDKGYKRMKKVFTSPFNKKLFRWLHPDIGMAFGNYLSTKNKLISGDSDSEFLGNEKEWLVQYAKMKLTQQHFDYFIFGHRHLPLEITLSESSTYLNLGDWISYFSYAEFDGKSVGLKYFK